MIFAPKSLELVIYYLGISLYMLQILTTQFFQLTHQFRLFFENLVSLSPGIELLFKIIARCN